MNEYFLIFSDFLNDKNLFCSILDHLNHTAICIKKILRAAIKNVFNGSF